MLEEHKQTINAYAKEIHEYNYQIIMSKIYQYAKKIAVYYYEENPYGLQALNYYILSVEQTLKDKKILNIPISFRLDDEINNFIDHLVYTTRKSLISKHIFQNTNIIHLNNVRFANKCMQASEIVQTLCDTYHFENYLLAIYPGYQEEAKLYDDTGYHYANIVYDQKYYLIDVTYPQFFHANQNNLDRIGIIGLANCDVGTFALMHETRRKVAIQLLQNGYIELDEETFKAYLDPFTISFRNGLYYENKNDFSYTTPYTSKDYIRFLTHKDNQLNHEGKENLGYQKRPLKNWNLNFYGSFE